MLKKIQFKIRTKATPTECLHRPTAIQGVLHTFSLVFSTKDPRESLVVQTVKNLSAMQETWVQQIPKDIIDIFFIGKKTGSHKISNFPNVTWHLLGKSPKSIT